MSAEKIMVVEDDLTLSAGLCFELDMNGYLTVAAYNVIIALVGVLNFANSMITAIVSRKREFAMIQSVGMTKRQLRRMLVYEGLYYAGLTLLASWIVSALAVGIGVRAVTAADDFSTFRFTLLPLGVCTPLLFILAVLIPCLCFLNLEKQSVVERLRME